ncbi:hypothetical protein K1719_024052 [Acacia pycnantha]|nr:hypothetical protein K1719_024052 [Acacia pycnantha]
MKPFGRTLVVKLLGRQPSYGFMVKKLRQIWERKGNIDIFDLENDFYLVSFQHVDDYMEALTGGPWVINDAYLNVARWRPDFNPKSERIESVVAWVRFPDLPVPLFDKKFLLNLGNVIGKAIKLDVHTAQRARGRFARMCVELDLTKPLVPQFDVEGQILSIAYESLGLLCNKCGWFGHSKEVCVEFHKRGAGDQMEVETMGARPKAAKRSEVKEELWKTVQRPRRQRASNMPSQSYQKGSRFSVLGDGGEEENVQKRDEGEVKDIRSSDGIGKGQVKSTVVTEQGSSKGKEEKSSKKAVSYKGKGEHGYAKEAYHMQDSCEVVPESNLELYRDNEMNMVDKENLHPGDQNCNEGFKRCVGSMKVDRSKEVNGQCGSTDLWAASKGVAAVVRDMKRRYKLDMVVILEPRISGPHANRVIRNWGFAHSYRVEAEGFSGGIWLLWELDGLTVNVLERDEQYVHCNLILGGNNMIFTAVYASPNEQRRSRIWDLLHQKANLIVDPWLIAGDFNEIKSPLEQKGGGRINEHRCRKFNAWIQECNLIDIEANGPFFTWKGPKWDGLDRVYRRLDRCLCNEQWQKRFVVADVCVIPRVCSDHHPLLARLNGVERGYS